MQNVANTHAFISYSRKDKELANRMAIELTSLRVPIFLDPIIPVGDVWEKVLHRALRTCFSVVVIWTENSVLSQWVHTEVRSGIRRSCLLPVKCDDCHVPEDFAHIEAADLRSGIGPVSGLEWRNFSESIAKRCQLAGTAASYPVLGDVNFELGQKFFYGLDAPRNPALAKTCFEKARAEGHPSAHDFLSVLADI